MNELEAQASGTNFWSFRTLVDLQTQQVVAAIGDLAGNVGFATNTILLNLTTNAAYAYDMAGNVTNISYNAGEETVGLVWNSQYELTAVHTNGALAESYRYDPLGRRVRTITGTVTNYHLYNGIHSLADLDATGAVLRAYAYGPGIDNLLAMTTFSDTETNHYYYLTDHLGSVLAITDAEGEIVERYHYDAWGRGTITDAVGLPLAESAIGNRFGFQGREHSWATGLIHFRARWYDPITGRWLSNDPIGISGGLNQYVAFGNNAVRFIDPDGRKVRLMGTKEEQRILLGALRDVLRGTLSLAEGGYVSRDPCDQDEDYDRMFDKLIASDAIYEIRFGDAVLYGGGSWQPWGFSEGGRITIEKDAGSFTYTGYTGLLRFEPGVIHTHGTILAHELGHAFLHVTRTRNADVRPSRLSPRQRERLESGARRWENKVMGRMGKPRRSS